MHLEIECNALQDLCESSDPSVSLSASLPPVLQVHAGFVRCPGRAAVRRLPLPAGESPLAPQEGPEPRGPSGSQPDQRRPERGRGVQRHQNQHRGRGERVGWR